MSKKVQKLENMYGVFGRPTRDKKTNKEFPGHLYAVFKTEEQARKHRTKNRMQFYTVVQPVYE